MTDDYELLDSGDGRKLERFGKHVLARPCSQARWRPCKSCSEWERADASFDREDGNRWHSPPPRRQRNAPVGAVASVLSAILERGRLDRAGPLCSNIKSKG